MAPQATAAGAGPRGTAHSTVQTLLRQLQAKGAVTYDVEDRTFVYRPLYQEAEVTETATRESAVPAVQRLGVQPDGPSAQARGNLR